MWGEDIENNFEMSDFHRNYGDWVNWDSDKGY